VKDSLMEMRKSVRLRCLNLIFLFSVMAAAGGCSQSQTNYQITLHLHVNGHDLVARNVQSIGCRDSIKWAASMDTANCWVHGEAVSADIGNGEKIFLVFKGQSFDTTSYALAVLSGAGADPFSPNFEAEAQGKWTNELSKLPALVVFDDLGAPTTAAIVSPAQLPNGATITSFEVEKTTSPVTRGRIRQLLPWLSDNTSLYLTGTTASFGGGAAGSLQHADFIRK
jgi:hypothetical protein